MSFKCAEVLFPSCVRQCAIAPGGVPVCGSVPGVPVPALSRAFTGEPAPHQVLALPILPQTGVLSKRGVGWVLAEGKSEVVPIKGLRSELR